MAEFVHLHAHSHYSLLDGACRIEDLVKAASDNGMSAVALTDHGVLFGALEFYKKAEEARIKPIIGMEAYAVTRGSRFDRSPQEADGTKKRAGYHHLLLLARNETGYRNLVRLTSLAHTEGYYYKPRVDAELLMRYREGLIATSACAGGVISAHLIAGRDELAYEAAEIYKGIFGEDFYVEIQDHGLESEAVVRRKAPKLARDLGLHLVATNDVHYIRPEHALPHNILLLIPEATNGTIEDYTTLRYQTDQVYFKSGAEMHRLFEAFPEAIRSTLEIAEKCDVKLDLKTSHMPAFPIPPESGVCTPEDYLERLAREGFTRRYPQPGPDLTARLEQELAVIRKMGYAGYFLVVQDFINAARRMGVPVGPGRGSAAGSIVSYALGITSVDPIRHGLLFERFLNPDRVSMPDIDVDFADDGRDRVIEYVRGKYGQNSVSQIITFGTLSSRAVLKDVGRVLGLSVGYVEGITKQIPVELGKVRPLRSALETIPELKELRESADARIRTLVDTSLVLEGMNRGAGMHAAGVVIAPGDISDYVPLYKTPQTELMTQYSMKHLEAAGLLKMDFLGLRTLSVIKNCVSMIRANHGIEVDPEALPEEDPETFALFARGQTVAVFQFESSGMQDWLRKLRPTCLSDLVAMNALYRPGPMDMIGDFIARKHGEQRISYPHPKLEPILRETYGVIVYQEQVMKIASDIGGFTLARADEMRRAMGKKDKLRMARMRDDFIEGAVGQGTPREKAVEIYELIEKFASYGFNKSHSVAYSVLAYQTAWLKAHYPAEYMAATLSSEMGSTDKIVALIDDCRKLGIQVLPPDGNESGKDFTVVGGAIRFGLCGIRNVGEGAVESVLDARVREGPFRNLFDFCARVDLRLVNKKCLESLIQAGAFDSLEGHRSRFFENIDRAVTYGQSVQSGRVQGQSTLFDAPARARTPAEAFPPLAGADPWPESEKLTREKAMMGFYVSGHPLLRFREEIEAFSTVRLGNPGPLRDGAPVRACGIVAAIRTKNDRRGKKMAFITLEDFTGRGEAIVFSDPFARYGSVLRNDAMVMVVGKGEANGDALRILVSEAYPLEEVRARFARSVLLSIDLSEVKEATILDLRRLMEQNRGRCPCFLRVVGPGATRMFQARDFTVEPSEAFLSEARRMLGPGSVTVHA
ncbi:MAG: DNA polymerase III subunit alpha [Bacteroidota bacterium]